MKPLVAFPDAERLAVDYLTDALADRDEDVTVGVDLPATWTTASKNHVQVALDGTPIVTYPALAKATVRVTAWSGAATQAKALAGLAMSLLLTHPGSSDIASVRPLTGVLPARDPDSGAQLASITVQVNLRSTALV